jgi:hypothetical protein
MIWCLSWILLLSLAFLYTYMDVSFFVISVFIMAMPVVFYLIFGISPFEALRLGVQWTQLPESQAQSAKLERSSGADLASARVDAMALPASVPELVPVVVEPMGEQNNNPRELLFRFAQESNTLAQRVYLRSGTYLFVGVFIALGGLGFFYLRSINLPLEINLMDRVLSLLPGFGILFFIEFVALFFLRQHRAAMDDFRYYDAVRRHRQENLVILTMFAENNNVAPTADVIKAMKIYSGDEKLARGETTEILEARRLQRDDIVIFEKLVEAFGAIKEAAIRPKKR